MLLRTSTLIALAALLVAPLWSDATARVAFVAATIDDDDPPDDDPEEEAVEVSIEKITSIEYRKGKKLPADIADLDGKRVKIEGYMALGTMEGVERFELVPEPCECGRSKVQHFIDVTLTDGMTTYKPGRLLLVGKFSVSEKKEDGYVVSLYRLEIESLE